MRTLFDLEPELPTVDLCIKCGALTAVPQKETATVQHLEGPTTWRTLVIVELLCPCGAVSQTSRVQASRWIAAVWGVDSPNG